MEALSGEYRTTLPQIHILHYSFKRTLNYNKFNTSHICS